MSELPVEEREAILAAAQADSDANGDGSVNSVDFDNAERIIRAYRAALAAREEPSATGFTREDLESDEAFRAAEKVLTGELGTPDREESHADLYGAIVEAVLDKLGESVTSREVEELPGDGQRADIDLLAERVGKFTLWVRPHTESRSCVDVEGEYYWGETPSAAINFALLAVRMGVRDTEEALKDAMPPCTFEKSCSYAEGMPRDRWADERQHEPDDGPEIWVDEGIVTDEPRGYIVSERSHPVLNKPVAYVPKATLERLRSRLVACEPGGECPVCGGETDHVDTCEVGVLQRHAEVLAKALDQFFRGVARDAHWGRLLTLTLIESLERRTQPTLQALGYPKEEVCDERRG